MDHTTGGSAWVAYGAAFEGVGCDIRVWYEGTCCPGCIGYGVVANEVVNDGAAFVKDARQEDVALANGEKLGTLG